MYRRLDRVRLFRIYEGYAGEKQYKSLLAKAEGNCKAWGMKMQSTKYSTRFTALYGVGVTSTSISIKFFPVKFRSGIAIDCTPSKLTPVDWADFRSTVENLFGDGGVMMVIKDFKLTSLEVALDVKLPFDEMVCIAPGIKVENLNYLSKGTHYLGQKGGRRTYCIYDKRKQLADKVAVDLGHDLTRIEVRHRHLGRKVGELATVKNPFGQLVAIQKSALSRLCKKCPDDQLLSDFANAVMNGESPQAFYFGLSKHHKHQLAARLATGALNLNGEEDRWEKWIKNQSTELIENFIG